MTAETFLSRARRNANSIAMRYGAPVWLVGGALTDEHPRDYDVRLILTDALMYRLYGWSNEEYNPLDYAEWEWARGYDNLKQSKLLSIRLMVPVDFQVQSLAEAKPYQTLSRTRIDTTPDWIFKKCEPFWLSY